MAPLTFADTHNMIAFLTKSNVREGFDQIMDFLNAHTIQYALMVNPSIYVLCIKQFWVLVSVTKTNDVMKLQALINKKKVVITKDTIQQALRLDDVDGVDCLSNEEIFAELTRIGYKKLAPKLTFYKAFFSAQWKFLIHTIVQCMSAKSTAWNEFSSSMASTVICLATCRKFNFSKYIFDSLVRNVDSPSKFIMYPWFLKVFINAQGDDLSSHNNKYTSPSLIQKVFAYMRRIGKGFLRVETPLVNTMLVQPQVQDVAEVEEDEDDEVSAAPTPPLPTPTTTSPPQQEPIPSPPQAQPAQSSLPQMEDNVTVVKEINAAEPTVFNDEEMQEKHADNIKKYKSLNKKPISVAQVKKNMIVYLKNKAGTPNIGFMRPFGCPVLNTLDPLGKFGGKTDEGFLVGYSVSSKAFRVFNSRTRISQERLHINFLENQSNVTGNGPTWLSNIDTLTQSKNYQSVVAGNQPNHNAYPQNTDADAAFDVKKNESEVHVSSSSRDKPKKHDEKDKREAKGKSLVDLSTGLRDLSDEFEEFFVNSTNMVNDASAPVTAVGPNSTNSTNSFNAVGPSDNDVSPNFEIGRKSSFVDPSQYPDDPDMPALEDNIYSDDEEDVGAEADFSNLETSITVSPTPTSRVHKDHQVTQIIGDLTSAS
nr:hypothetical protein [Tanacetum cinerariifolium]